MIDDIDLGLIDAYLDDALSAEEVERLDGRLSREPELAAALHAVRSQRALRSSLWQSEGPSDAAADQLARRVVGVIRRRERARIARTWIRVAGAVAACLLFGFVAGWIGRGRIDLPWNMPAHPASDVRTISHSGVSVDPSSGIYQVALTDDAGNVVAVQKFARYDEARQFADDLAVYEARRQQVQQGRARLVSSDRF